MNNGARDISYGILRKFEASGKRLDRLEKEFKLNETLSQQDKKLAKNLISGSVRHLLYLDWIAGQLYHGSYKKLLIKTKTILRLALYELIFMEHIPARATINEYVNMAKKTVGKQQANMINAILRNFTRGKAELKPKKLIKDDEERISIQYSFPRWIVKRWITLWGMTEAEALCSALNKLPDFDLRINTALISVDEFFKMLDDAGVEFKKSIFSAKRVKVTDIQAVIENGWFDKGYCSLQDESAALPVELLGIHDGDLVLDVCSAPGGKLTQILEEEKKDVLLLALDIDISRLKQVKKNVQRLKKKNILFVVADGTALPLKPVFSKVLLDAPCSGLGILRRNPEKKWRPAPDFATLSSLQARLIRNAAAMVRPGGILVYSTCTVHRQENEAIVQGFTAEYGDFVVEEVAPLLPDGLEDLCSEAGHFCSWARPTCFDLFFAARLRRISRRRTK